MILIVFPFIGAAMGMKRLWDSNWKLAAITIPYLFIFIYIGIVPTAVPFIQALAPVLPPDVLSSMGFVYIILISLILSSSVLNAIGYKKITNEKEEIRTRSYAIIVDIIVMAHITFGFLIVYYFAIKYKPFDFSFRSTILFTCSLIIIIALAIFFTIAKKSFIKNLYLLSPACPICQGEIDRENGRCVSCAAKPEAMVKIIASKKHLKLPRKAVAAALLSVFLIGACEVGLSWASTNQASKVFQNTISFQDYQYYSIEITVDAPFYINFSSTTDSIDCYIFQDHEKYENLIFHTTSESGESESAIINVNGIHKFIIWLLINNDTDASNDTSITIMLQLQPRFRITGLFFTTACILIVYVMLYTRLVSGKILKLKIRNSSK
ncbi:MAG: hypothetical protein ACTSRA_22910, partial [Promethearchaeota archaeon]